MQYPAPEEFPPIIKGATWDGIYYVCETEDDGPFDLTNYNAEFFVADSITSTAYILHLTSQDGQLILGGKAGSIVCAPVSPTTTNALATASRRIACLKLIYPDGINSDFLLVGTIDIQEVI